MSWIGWVVIGIMGANALLIGALALWYWIDRRRWMR